MNPVSTSSSESATSEVRGLTLMLLSILCFAINTLAVRGLAIHFPGCTGWQITFFRGLSGLAVVLALYQASGKLRLRSLIDRPKVFLRGLLGAVGVTIYYLTVIELGAARAVVINLTYPIFAALLAIAFLGERPGPRRMTWIILGFIGLVIFMSPRATTSGLGFYDILAIVGAIVAACVVVLIRLLHRSEHGSTIFASQAIFCIFWAFPMSAPTTLSIPPAGIIGLIIAGLVVAAGQLTMTFAYRHLDVSRGASLQMLLPITTAAGAWFLFNESLGPIEIIGAALTLIATVMIHRRASKALTKMPIPNPNKS